MAHTELIEFTS